jgi:hypothetical protein
MLVNQAAVAAAVIGEYFVAAEHHVGAGEVVPARAVTDGANAGQILYHAEGLQSGTELMCLCDSRASILPTLLL